VLRTFGYGKFSTGKILGHTFPQKPVDSLVLSLAKVLKKFVLSLAKIVGKFVLSLAKVRAFTRAT
jgi:hypothetical protein